MAGQNRVSVKQTRTFVARGEKAVDALFVQEPTVIGYRDPLLKLKRDSNVVRGEAMRSENEIFANAFGSGSGDFLLLPFHAGLYAAWFWGQVQAFRLVILQTGELLPVLRLLAKRQEPSAFRLKPGGRTEAVDGRQLLRIDDAQPAERQQTN